MTNKKKKKPSKKKKAAAGKSPAQKAADTMRKRRLEEAAKKAGRLGGVTDKKPDEERPDVEITPYPRTSDNKEFENILDADLGEEKKPAPPPASAKPAEPEKPAEVIPEKLVITDVVEWVGWPFMLWAQVNSLPPLALTPKEAMSLAVPLTSILNRHGASRLLPPDYIEGLTIAARLEPIVAQRFTRIKTERARRAASGTVTPTRPAPGPSRMEYPQGAQATKPKEV